MAKVTLQQIESHAAWKEGEIVTLQIVGVGTDGAYDAETLETFAPDLKERHRAEIEELGHRHEQALADAYEANAEVVASLRRQQAGGATPA